MEITLCNMVMIEDRSTGRVLVQHRLPKPTNPWCGLTFPGGHVEAGESVTDSAIREIREETGLRIENLRMCGIVEWETIGKRTEDSPAEVADNSKYIVFMFRTQTFSGKLKSSGEGKMEWMTLDEMRKGDLAPHMAEYLRVIMEDDVPQAYGISGSGKLKVREKYVPKPKKPTKQEMEDMALCTLLRMSESKWMDTMLSTHPSEYVIQMRMTKSGRGRKTRILEAKPRQHLRTLVSVMEDAFELKSGLYDYYCCDRGDGCRYGSYCALKSPLDDQICWDDKIPLQAVFREEGEIVNFVRKAGEEVRIQIEVAYIGSIRINLTEDWPRVISTVAVHEEKGL